MRQRDRHSMPELSELISRLERGSGPAAGEPVPLTAGSRTATTACVSAGATAWCGCPGRDTELLGIDRAAERLAAERPRASASGPSCSTPTPTASVTAFVPGAAGRPRSQLRADPGTGGARAARLPRQRPGAADALLDPGPAARLRGDGRASAARCAADGVSSARRRWSTRIARRAAARPTRCPATTTCCAGNLIQHRRTRSCWSTGSTPGSGHRYFDLGNLAVNNEFDEDGRAAAARGVLRRARAGRRAARRPALFRLVSDAREAAWGVVQGLISELDFDFAAYADEHFERLERAAADPRLEEYLNAATA